MIKGQSSTGKTVLVIVETLEDMQADLRVNGNTNGNSGHSAQEAEPGKTVAVARHHGHQSEEDYERFLWHYFGEPHINHALEICAEIVVYVAAHSLQIAMESLFPLLLAEKSSRSAHVAIGIRALHIILDTSPTGSNFWRTARK